MRGERNRVGDAKVGVNKLADQSPAFFRLAALPDVVDKNREHTVAGPEYPDENGSFRNLKLRGPLGEACDAVLAVDVIAMRNEDDVLPTNRVEQRIERRRQRLDVLVIDLQRAYRAASRPCAHIDEPMHRLSSSPTEQLSRRWSGMRRGP